MLKPTEEDYRKKWSKGFNFTGATIPDERLGWNWKWERWMRKKSLLFRHDFSRHFMKQKTYFTKKKIRNRPFVGELKGKKCKVKWTLPPFFSKEWKTLLVMKLISFFFSIYRQPKFSHLRMTKWRQKIRSVIVQGKDWRALNVSFDWGRVHG